MTQAFGINDRGEVVGTYTVGTGNNAVTHGFTWLNGKWTTVNYSARQLHRRQRREQRG